VLIRRESRTNPDSPLPRSVAAQLDRVAPVERIHWNEMRPTSLGLMQTETTDFTISEYANIAVVNERVHVGNGSSPEYKVYSGAGKLMQIVRWRGKLIPVTTEMREAAIRRGFPPSPAKREYLPFYATLQLGQDDAVWLQDYVFPAGAATGYTVFDRNGQLLGRVEVPARSESHAEVRWIGGNRVLLGWRDEDGSPHLTVHQVVRQP